MTTPFHAAVRNVGEKPKRQQYIGTLNDGFDAVFGGMSCIRIAGNETSIPGESFFENTSDVN